MNILYVATGVPYPVPCGGTVHVHEVAKNLRKLGHNVVIVTKKIDGGLLKPIDDVSFYKLSWKLHDIPWGRTITRFIHAIQLVYICIKHKIEIILERESSDGSGGLASQLLGLPLVAEVNDDKYNILSLKVADKIICTYRRIIPKRYRHKVHVVTWAADTDKIKPGLNSEVKKELNIQTPVIGYIGSFYPWHGIEYLVEAAPLILDKFDVRFLLVGDAKIGSKSSKAYLNKIKRIIKMKKLDNFFIFTGRVSYETVPKYLTVFDICVAPYDPNKTPELRKYGFFYTPLKLFEYLAAGKPVVTTDVGNIRKIIEPNRGVLVPPGDPQGLANAIIDLLNSSSIMRKLSRNARAYAKNRSWYKHCKQLEKLLEDALW